VSDVAAGAADAEQTEVAEVAGVADPQAYITQVMAEIEDEVRLRRTSGDLPPKLERELDELFLAHSPVAGRGGDLTEALRMVDAATFVDPVVPVDSQRAAGAAVKKGMRTLLLWYVGWITHQISQFASAVSRTLHIVEGRLKELERKVEVQRVPSAGVIDVPTLHDTGAWWVPATVAVVKPVRGRILHAASGDGWLVQKIIEAGGDAYGVDPRTNLVEQGVRTVSDLRGEDLADHLRAVAPAGLGAIVLSGVVDGMASGERTQLLDLIGRTLEPGGVLVVHSLSRAAWDSEDAPYEADLAPGRPLRMDTWRELLADHGYDATVASGPGAADYLVTAIRATVFPPEPTPAR
jgi:hypothetical protein